MKNFIMRLLSFFLDLMLLTILVNAIANTSFFDGYNSDIYLMREDALRVNKEYEKLNEEIDDILKDALISEAEFNYIQTNFMDFRMMFEGIKADGAVTKKYIDNFHEDLDKNYQDIYNEELYAIAKKSRYQNVIAIVLYILYFGVLQYILKGQTIFKRIFRIKVVDNKDSKRKVPLWKFIIRAILVCDVIFTTIDLIGLSNLTLDRYLSFNTVLGNVRYFYEVAFILVLFLRDDQRSIHDLLLNTRVIRFNKEGKIIKDVIFKNNGETKEREVVKAIKVDD